MTELETLFTLHTQGTTGTVYSFDSDEIIVGNLSQPMLALVSDMEGAELLPKYSDRRIKIKVSKALTQALSKTASGHFASKGSIVRAVRAIGVVTSKGDTIRFENGGIKYAARAIADVSTPSNLVSWAIMAYQGEIYCAIAYTGGSCQPAQTFPVLACWTAVDRAEFLQTYGLQAEFAEWANGLFDGQPVLMEGRTGANADDYAHASDILSQIPAFADRLKAILAAKEEAAIAVRENATAIAADWIRSYGATLRSRARAIEFFGRYGVEFPTAKKYSIAAMAEAIAVAKGFEWCLEAVNRASVI
jgi:hypothetical protein